MKQVTAITGGAGGIGRAVAIALGRSSVIVIGDLLQDNIDYTSRILTSLNIEHYCMKMDIRKREECDAFMKFAAQYGEIKNFINIAGVGPNTTYTEAIIATRREIYDTNSVAAVNTVEAALPYMKEGSVMIQTASQAANYAAVSPEMLEIFKCCCDETFLDKLCLLTAHFESEETGNGAAYCLSKLFVKEYCKALAKRFAEKGVRIVTVSPGPHWTCHVWDLPKDMQDWSLSSTPAGCYGRTKDLGEVYAFLCSDDAKFISGTDLLVDGGGVAAVSPWQIQYK